MKLKTKNLLMLGCAVAFTLCAGIGMGTAVSAEAEEIRTSSVEWGKPPEDGEGLPDTWTANADGSMTTTNTAFTGNFLLTTNETLVGDYSVEATFKGSKDTEVTQEINMGIVPWFQDKANYAIVYMVWRPANKFNMINVQTICFKDGVHQGWNDHWLDNLYTETLFQFKPTDEITLHIDKQLNAEGTLDMYKVTVKGTLANGTAVEQTPAEIGFSVSVPHAAQQAYAGVYAMNDTVTVSNFKTQSLTETGVYKHVSEGTTGRSTSTQGWKQESGTYSVDATGGTAEQNQLVLLNEYQNENYQISFNANCENAENRQLSILPLYYNESTFVRFTVNQTATGAEIIANGKIGGEPFAQDAVPYTGTIDWSNVRLSASKTGTKFALELNNEQVTEYENAALIDGGKVAIGAGGTKCTIGSVELKSLRYEPYSWYTENGWFLSAQTKEQIAITDNSGSYSLTLASAAGETKFTRAYRASGMYNEVSAEGKFVSDNAKAQFGLYLSYTDEQNSVYALVGDEKAVLMSMVGGKETEIGKAALPQDFDVTKENALQVYAKYEDVTVSLNGEALIREKVSALSGIETGNVGAIVLGGKVSVTDFRIDGFWANKIVTEGKWTLQGRRLSTWTVEEDKVVADGSMGTDFKATIATTDLQDSPADGYYVGAAITITELYGSEWKTAIMPYYKDASNYVFVWLSQWSNGGTTITITAALNGKIVGNEWRETEVAYTMKDAVNYLEINVKGDGIYVYLNKSFSPTVTTSIEGLGSCETAKYGFNVLNTSATFADITVSKDRIFKETGEPEITVIGSVPTAGVVGTQIKLPVFSATGVGGATADVVISVKDPDGQNVELAQNKFTPAKSGTYRVTVTATDAWGNSVSDDHAIEVTGPDQEPVSKGCCGMIESGGYVAFVTLLLGVGTVVAVVVVKKKHKN